MFGSNRRVSGPIEERGGPPPNEYAPGMPTTRNRTAGSGRAVPSPISQPQQSTPQQSTPQPTASQQTAQQPAGNPYQQQSAGNPYQQQSSGNPYQQQSVGQQSAPYGNAGAEPRMSYPGSLPPPIAGAPRRMGRGGAVVALVAILVPLVALLVIGLAFAGLVSQAGSGLGDSIVSAAAEPADPEIIDSTTVTVASPTGEQAGFALGDLEVGGWTFDGDDRAALDVPLDELDWTGDQAQTQLDFDVTFLGEGDFDLGSQYCAGTLTDGEVTYLVCGPEESTAAVDRVRQVRFDLR